MIKVKSSSILNLNTTIFIYLSQYICFFFFVIIVMNLQRGLYKVDMQFSDNCKLFNKSNYECIIQEHTRIILRSLTDQFQNSHPNTTSVGEIDLMTVALRVQSCIVILLLSIYFVIIIFLGIFWPAMAFKILYLIYVQISTVLLSSIDSNTIVG